MRERGLIVVLTVAEACEPFVLCVALLRNASHDVGGCSGGYIYDWNRGYLDDG